MNFNFQRYKLYFLFAGLLLLIVLIPVIIISCNNSGAPEEDYEQVVGRPRQAILANAVEDRPAIPTPPPEGQIWIAVVTANLVNVREAATSQSQSFGTVNSGDMLKIISNQPTMTGNDPWFAVRFNNRDAFIHGNFLAIESVDADAIMLIATVIDVQTYVNIREEASVESNRIGRARLGERLRVVEYDAAADWTRIQFRAGSDTAIGFVRSDFLEIEELALEDLLL